MYNLINKVYYHEFYGTPEDLNNSIDTIYNISSFIKCIAQEIDTDSFKRKNNELVQDRICIGTMTIDMYTDKKLSFSYTWLN